MQNSELEIEFNSNDDTNQEKSNEDNISDEVTVRDRDDKFPL